MSKFLKLTETIYSKNGDYCKMQKTNKILDNYFAELEATNKEHYIKVMNEIEHVAYDITLEEARNIVNSMKPHGQKWDYDTISNFIKQRGISNDCLKFYLVMNMMYNDFYNVFAKAGKQEDAEFYFEMAKAFIYDEDAKPFKVEKYFI